MRRLLPLGLAVLLGACAAPERSSVAPPRPAPPVTPGSASPSLEPGPPGGADPSTAASDRDDQDAAASPAPAGTSTPAGWIAGQPLAFEELLLEWHAVSPREVFLVLEKLVAARLAFAEADRLGIRLEPAVVDAAVAQQLAGFEEEVAASGLGLTTDEFIRYELGVEPARYRARVREGSIRQAIAERAVRAWAYETGSATARLIVVAEQDHARALAAEAAAGADFAELARRHSVDESAPTGGLLAFLVRQEESPLARLVFRTEPGTVGGPIPAAGHWFLVRVEEVRPPNQGGWGVLQRQVESSLAAHPVDESEFLHWKLAMERRYPVDLGPLMELIGAPRLPAPAGGEAPRAASADPESESGGSAP